MATEASTLNPAEGTLPSVPAIARARRSAQIPELVYFDHLHSEYLTFRANIENKEVIQALDMVAKKREDATLSWSDVYFFELTLVDHQPVDVLWRKILRYSSDLLRVAGQTEYNRYVSSRPSNFLLPPDPANLSGSSGEDYQKNMMDYENLVRGDLKDLLNRLHLRYAMLPVKEGRLRRLTTLAAIMCGAALLSLVLFIVLIVTSQESTEATPAGGQGGVASMSGRVGGNAPAGSATGVQNTNPPGGAPAGQNGGAAAGTTNANPGAGTTVSPPAPAEEGLLETVFSRISAAMSLSIFVVLFAGAMGGLVSLLQRAQSPVKDSDSIYGLSLLYNGTYIVFVAPLTGAIFAILLYFMFTGKILEGNLFPDIDSPPPSVTAAASPSPSASPARTLPPADSQRARPDAAGASENSSSAASNNAAGGNVPVLTLLATESVTDQPASDGGGAAPQAAQAEKGPTAAPGESAPTPATQQPSKGNSGKSTNRIREMLQTEPRDGPNYALLIVWCFIAGFAERFVPDTLNRLIPNGDRGGAIRA